MRISFNLNGTAVQISALANERLSIVLRREFDLKSIKASCLDGLSGLSVVLMNDNPIPASLVPVFKAEGSNIVSLEHFKTTEDYKIISNCFEQAGVETCGFCDSGKIFFAYSLLKSNLEVTHSNIEKAIRFFFAGTMCRCTSFDDLVLGIDKLLKQKN